MICYILFYGWTFWPICDVKLQEGNSNLNWAGYAKVTFGGPHFLHHTGLAMTCPTTNNCVIEGLQLQLLIINLIDHRKYNTYCYNWNLRFLHNKDLYKLADELRGVLSHSYRS